MDPMSVTREVFQDPISWSNAAALWNIFSMVVTELTSHAEMLALK